MKCIKCKKNNVSQANYCIKCGYKFTTKDKERSKKSFPAIIFRIKEIMLEELKNK